jgi:multiple sugar transport system substrate-binding protein
MGRTFEQEIDRRAFIRAGLVSAAGLTLLGGCGGEDSDAGSPGASGTYKAPPSSVTGELNIYNWGDPGDKKVYEAVAARFKRRYPKVSVNDNFTPITTWSDYINKLVSQVTAGKPPDVINIAIEGMRLGLDKRLFMPLDSYRSRDKAGVESILGDTRKELLASMTFDGKLHFLPNTWNTMVIYYNTRLFREAGVEAPSPDWTWDDFLQTAQRLTTGSGSSKIYGFGLPYFNFALSPWWYSNGAAPFSADLKKANFTDPRMVEAVSFVRDLVVKHRVAPQPKGADPYQLFQTERVAMTGAGHWQVGPFLRAKLDNFDVVDWPQKATKATVLGPVGFGIYPKSKNPDLAWEYAKELAGPQTQSDWVQIGAANPASTTAANSEEFLRAPSNAKRFNEAIGYAKPLQAPAAFNEIEPALLRELDQVMNGSKSSQAAMESVQKAASDAIAGA